MEEDYKHPKMFHSTGCHVELDVYIESLKLAFEYQGEQHYRPIHGMGTNYEGQQIRDEEKREACIQVLQLYYYNLLILLTWVRMTSH